MHFKTALILSIMLFINTWAVNGKTPFRSGVGYATIGMTRFDLSEFNQPLEQQGYPGFQSQFIVVGGGGYGQRGRLIFGGDGMAFYQAPRTADGFESIMSGGLGVVKIGYAFINKPAVVLFPFLGIGGGGFRYRRYPTEPVEFNDALSGNMGSVNLHYAAFVLRVALQGEYRLWKERKNGHTGGMIIGVQAGYTFPVAKGKWKIEETEVVGGPAIHFSGPFLTIIFGGGGIHQKKK